MYVEPLDITENIIKEKYPEYLENFNKLHKRTSAHMFNMFIMKKDIFNDYCKWLFDILSELEKRVDNSEYNQFHSRFYGRISELLLDVYLQKNNLSYKEIGFIYMEKINKINKIISFLKAFFLAFISFLSISYFPPLYPVLTLAFFHLIFRSWLICFIDRCFITQIAGSYNQVIFLF